MKIIRPLIQSIRMQVYLFLCERADLYRMWWRGSADSVQIKLKNSHEFFTSHMQFKKIEYMWSHHQVFALAQKDNKINLNTNSEILKILIE